MIRVMIADDHVLVRDSVSRLLSTYPDIDVIDQVGSGAAAIRRAAVGDLDVVLLDVSMPGPGFVEVIEQINEAGDAPRVLVLSGCPEDQFAIRALRAGAAGYFTKDGETGDLAAAIRQVRAGRPYVSEGLAEQLATRIGQPEGTRPDHERLSRREFEVLALFGEGHGTAEIGVQLGLSVKTVSTYRSRLLEKLGLRSTPELIRYAVERRVGRD